ncbi:hypothetical protein CROQUDRAFT_663902 [Cronartium quercuum f. sp. fusiforme G11]|uniref:Retrovirus-related Pol polyprotein from transposon TNT 1-94-like beta-barrel domain-containing protein n=1 Tax=Cronartium quercuum f. sp. fusiforme G11 TaxID=708437 RepID=A0A9P6T8D6_9BASI|nr:hypothetical protein CROQUDRAFT_663902 [Cronartium quercuum f. sp. fusiforme G11]
MECDPSTSHPSSPQALSSPTPLNSQSSSPTNSVHSSDTELVSTTIIPEFRLSSDTFRSIDIQNSGIMSQPTDESITTPQISMSQSNYSLIPTLSLGNFHVWRLRLVTFLGALNLQDYILKDIVALTDPTLLSAHTIRNCQALNAIQSTIDEENIEIITNYYTAHEAFDALCKHHSDSGGISTATLFYDLVNLRLQPGGSVGDHVHKFHQLHNRFVSNQQSTPSITISEHYIAILLLNSRSEPSSDTALTTSVKKSKPTREPRKLPICSLGHHGHMDEHCNTRIWAEEKEMIRKYKEMMAKKAHSAQLVMDRPLHPSPPQIPTPSKSDSPIPSYYDDVFTVTTPDTDQSRILTLDTGATAYMFGNANLLTNLEPIPLSPINVASKNGKIFARHRGTLKIGGLTLTNVLQANELAENLVSAGMLYDAGYKIKWTKTTADIFNSSSKFLL